MGKTTNPPPPPSATGTDPGGDCEWGQLGGFVCLSQSQHPPQSTPSHNSNCWKLKNAWPCIGMYVVQSYIYILYSLLQLNLLMLVQFRIECYTQQQHTSQSQTQNFCNSTELVTSICFVAVFIECNCYCQCECDVPNTKLQLSSLMSQSSTPQSIHVIQWSMAWHIHYPNRQNPNQAKCQTKLKHGQTLHSYKHNIIYNKLNIQFCDFQLFI